ncbi:MAG TPA: S-layer homology domain-containing protein [Symbiobacteriaceae bacterium]|jgi:hypothetical protein
MGFGHAGEYAVIDAGPGANAAGTAAWPYPGQTGVPTAWVQHERPNPLRLYPGVSQPVGPVVTLTFGTARPKRLTLETAVLTGPDGNAIPVMTFAPGNDAELNDTVSIIPKQPLTPGTTYRVHLAGAFEAGSYDRTWSFTTASAALDTVSPGFADIGGYWAEAAIRRLVLGGIVAGYPDGSFRPAESVTRAAFLKMLVAARGLPLTAGQTGGFADTAGHWATSQGYVGAAVASGFVVPAEYPGKTFAPDKPVTREEIAVMVVRALGLNLQASARPAALQNGRLTVNGQTFADGAAWSRPGYVATAVEQGIVTGYAESGGTYTFRPANPATRAEAAIMLTRMLDKSARH